MCKSGDSVARKNWTREETILAMDLYTRVPFSKASHIKPWSVSNIKTERTNPSNGLCLNAMHDKAFDRGLITIDKNYRIVNSRYIKDAVMDEKTREWFAFYNGKEIILPDKFLPGKEFIQYHNDVIFKGE